MEKFAAFEEEDTTVERYELSWPGKRQAMAEAYRPVRKTLRPVPGESVDWDQTQNLFIEGDNLDVLKLLQESYLQKVKCIYIDPPFNTGKDFIYNDNFRREVNDYLESSGQADEEGRRLFQNSEAGGRFHSDWLSMMYPRLKVARSLLSPDGTIFISIDDHECDNLKKICDEIFGESNFVSRIVVYSNPRGRQSAGNIAPTHEYILVYARDIDRCSLRGISLTPEQMREYNRQDEKGRYREIGLRLRGGRATAAESPSLHFPLFYDEEADRLLLTNERKGLTEILPMFSDGTPGTWRWSKDKILRDMPLLTVRPVRRKDGAARYDVFQKDYLTAEKTRKVKSWWDEKEINYDRGADEIKALFGNKLFDYAKPLFLIEKIMAMAADSDSLIMDFFAGSATTAHAVMRANAADGGARRYIMIQAPEPTRPGSKAREAGFQRISDLGLERLRRAAKAVRPSGGNRFDGGFRLFRLASSNMLDVSRTPEELRQEDLPGLAANIRADRTGADLLFQVLLECGRPLSSAVETVEIGGYRVYFAADCALAACFGEPGQKPAFPDRHQVFRTIAARKPELAVFRDDFFPDDEDRVNLEKMFSLWAPLTRIKVL